MQDFRILAWRTLLFIGCVTYSGCAERPAESTSVETEMSSGPLVNLPDVIAPKPTGSPAALGLAGYAKVLCSALFVSGREEKEAAYNSGYFLLPEELQDQATYSINWDRKIVEMRLGDSLLSRAQHYGDQGCIIHKGNRPEIFFEPVKVTSSLPDGSTQQWPMGDVIRAPDWSGIDKELIEEAVEQAFTPGETLTAAFVVLYNGQIIAERYGAGANMYMQLESWSMGKSLTATLIGRMIQLGYLKLDIRAPIESWQSEGDPREAITITNLLQMSSGLKFTAHRDPEAETYTDYLDHFFVYTGAINVFEYAINRPLQFHVGTEGLYRNCDPLALGYIMRQKLGREYWAFPQKELFDKIGIRSQILETDPYGNFLLTGYNYGTARNWARLGMLYLQNGEWNGEQLLPEGFAGFVSTPAPAWKEQIYGGLFWLNKTGQGGLPDDTYYMAGAGGQYTIIVPSLNLVIVRMGHFRGSSIGTEALYSACALIVKALSSH